MNSGSPRRPSPPPRPSRRTQAERTAETRARILGAVLESIAAVGFGRTTAAEITRRAGVTWGAVQHHFGDKDGILVAVVEDSFRLFESRLADVPIEAIGLPERVSLFIERAWAHFSSPEYRSTFEILLHYLGRDDRPESPRWQDQLFRAWDRVWRRLFHDAPITRRRHRLLEHYTVATLSGLATTLHLEGDGAVLRREELAILVDTLVRELSRPA